MKNSKGNTPNKIVPNRDRRWRISRSERLWVVGRSWLKDKTKVEVCGTIESIERSVYRLEGRTGKWVRYYNRYYPLHSADEFSVILARARKGEFYFFNNEAGGRGDAAADTVPAPFIVEGEEGPYA